MARKPREWSTAALAAAFEMNYRVVANRIKHVKPVREDRKPQSVYRYYHLVDVLPYLNIQTDPDGFTYEQARNRKMRVEAQLAELQLMLQTGQLLRIDDSLEAHLTRVFSTLRTRLLALPSRVVAELAPPEERADLKREFERLIDKFLYELRADLSLLETISDEDLTKPSRDQTGRELD